MHNVSSLLKIIKKQKEDLIVLQNVKVVKLDTI